MATVARDTTKDGEQGIAFTVTSPIRLIQLSYEISDRLGWTQPAEITAEGDLSIASDTPDADGIGGPATLYVNETGISVTFIMAHGDPYHEITRLAMETRADAIVVGASLKAGHRLMGSLAVRLVRAGKWPVTVVP